MSSQVDLALHVVGDYIGPWWVKPQTLLSAEQATKLKCNGCIHLLHHMGVSAGDMAESHHHYDLFTSAGYDKVKVLKPTPQPWVEKVKKVKTEREADELVQTLRAEWSRKLGSAATSAPVQPKVVAGGYKAQPKSNAYGWPFHYYYN